MVPAAGTWIGRPPAGTPARAGNDGNRGPCRRRGRERRPRAGGSGGRRRRSVSAPLRPRKPRRGRPPRPGIRIPAGHRGGCAACARAPPSNGRMHLRSGGSKNGQSSLRRSNLMGGPATRASHLDTGASAPPRLGRRGRAACRVTHPPTHTHTPGVRAGGSRWPGAEPPRAGPPSACQYGARRAMERQVERTSEGPVLMAGAKSARPAGRACVERSAPGRPAPQARFTIWPAPGASAGARQQACVQRAPNNPDVRLGRRPGPSAVGASCPLFPPAPLPTGPPKAVRRLFPGARR